MAPPGQKSQAKFSALFVLFILIFIGLCIVSKYAMNPNPLKNKELWLGIPLFLSMLENPQMKIEENPEVKIVVVNSVGDLALDGISVNATETDITEIVPKNNIADTAAKNGVADPATKTVDNYSSGIENNSTNDLQYNEPGSETNAIDGENDEIEGHLDGLEESPFLEKNVQVLSSPQESPHIFKPEEKPRKSSPPPLGMEEGRKGSLRSRNNHLMNEEEKERLSPKNHLITHSHKTAESEKKKCNLYSGSWSKDASYPLYQAISCPYVDEAFNCQDNGRPDSEYQQWRWQPHDCHLPRLNATDFLERLRGKRLMFVGDSMNRNQFESMLCILREGLANKSRMFETHGYRITKGRGNYIFKFMDYDCTVEFSRSHYLVREGRTVRPNGKTRPTLMIDRIDRTASRWKRANILVFNTGHWWTHGKTSKGKDYYQEGDVVYERLDVLTAFRRALTTWGKWIDENLRPKKTHVFYRGYSTAHFRGGQWNSGGRCTGETQPIFNESFIGSYPVKMQIVEDVIHQMHTPVTLLNVTRLTDFRKDGHPSAYGKHFTESGEKRTSRYQDCSHWCLPGVPDAWNELIYHSLVMEN